MFQKVQENIKKICEAQVRFCEILVIGYGERSGPRF